MAALRETTMTLRFFGDDLDPDDVTARLGCSPTFGAKKGSLWITKGGTEKVARTGFWRLIAKDRTPGDLNAQISELLANCTNDLSKWTDLTARFEASIFCGIFMLESNEGADLSPASLKSLGLRNLRLSLDIYDPTPPG
jgi:hypothetical protein